VAGLPPIATHRADDVDFPSGSGGTIASTGNPSLRRMVAIAADRENGCLPRFVGVTSTSVARRFLFCSPRPRPESAVVIRFLCPNGHNVHAPDEHAGRNAKCPQCGAKFQIPTPSKVENLPPDPEETPTPDVSVEPVVKEPEIEFLCPNGHRLHGPASLQGRPGECPECGSQFRIPSYSEDVSEEEHIEQEIGIGGVDGNGSTVDLEQAPEGPEAGESGYRLDVANRSGPPPMPTMSATGHPWAALLAKLWRQHTPGSVVEVFLSDGEALVPDRFSPAEGDSHAVFAVKNSNGTYTVTAVTWDSISRVLLRGLKKLPDEFFSD
jgi:Zn finger protein HypA/HybF involved in hydrogenase expression